MKKGYLVGGLAIVGAIALFMYLKPKNKANSEGFYGANGKLSTKNIASRANAGGIRCRRPDGTYYSQQAGATQCVYGSDVRVS
jgi:hypothetical protein